MDKSSSGTPVVRSCSKEYARNRIEKQRISCLLLVKRSVKASLLGHSNIKSIVSASETSLWLAKQLALQKKWETEQEELTPINQLWQWSCILDVLKLKRGENGNSESDCNWEIYMRRKWRISSSLGPGFSSDIWQSLQLVTPFVCRLKYVSVLQLNNTILTKNGFNKYHGLCIKSIPLSMRSVRKKLFFLKSTHKSERLKSLSGTSAWNAVFPDHVYFFVVVCCYVFQLEFHFVL